MGIPFMFSYIVKNHANIICKLSSSNIVVDNLYLDCNSIIYEVVHKLNDNSKSDKTQLIISEVIKSIENYIFLLKPTNSVFVAFDGVAPVAKLEQQRSRRFKSVYQNNISKTIFKNVESDPWNTTAITPGTLFMQNLDKAMYDYFSNPSAYNLSSIIVSGSDEYGEGEHKLFKYIRDCPEEHLNKNTIIYGLDADLIMLSINHLPIAPKIYLFRETPHFIQSVNSELEPNENYVMDIPELKNAIINNMCNGIVLNETQQINSIYDYIFLCFFLGNDFLPHFPALNIRTGGIDKLILAYKETIGGTNNNLTNGKNIYWKNVRKLIQYLANKEHEYFKNEHKLRDKREKHKLPENTPEEKMNHFNNIPTYDRLMEKFINPYNLNWESRYYTMFDIKIDDNRRRQICTNYLEGLEWTMKYYTTGCPDWRWKYNYSYPPLLCDLIQFVPYFDVQFIENRIDNPVNELVQLCYVLPKQSLQFLPDKLYKALIREKLDWYAYDCHFLWAYCRYFWESHPKLPNIEIDELEDFVKKQLL